MCNYNMEETLEASLSSILDQLDDNYEVLVVDDGSSDSSVEVIKSLQKRYDALRLVELRRDRKRKLGLTRNVSVKEARGKYVLLQLDCDDVYGPHIKDFVKVFHQIENCIAREFYLKGQKMNIGRRDFLLGHGPYRNLYRGEDRDMWARLAAIDAFIPINHQVFFCRLPKKTQKRIFGVIYNTWDHLKNDFRAGASLSRFLRLHLSGKTKFALRGTMLRCALAVPTWVSAKFAEPIPPPRAIGEGETFGAYRKRMQGSFPEIMRRHGCEADFSEFSPTARKIFG